MKKYAFFNVDSHNFLCELIFIVSRREVHGICSKDPADILLYDSVEEPLQIVNFLADISDGAICLTVAEVEVDE